MANSEPSFDEEAVRLLPSLYHFARWLTPRPADAEDLVQETYCRALRSRHRFLPATDLKAWLFTIMKHAAIDLFWRTRREGERVDLDEAEGAGDARLRLDPRGGEETLLRLDLGEALARLPAIYREAIFLSDVEGFTVREIAAIFGCAEGTVKARLSRGRLALRRMLGEKGPSHWQGAVR